MNSKSIQQFESLCSEISDKDKEVVTSYLKYFCPQGEDVHYRNYFFRLYWLATRSKSKKIVELGARPGGSTIALTWAVNKTKGQLWSCDIEDVPEVLPFTSELNLTRRIRVSETRASDLGTKWNNGLIDLIYLDTSHAYQDTCDEINAWLPHLKEGGLFVFHDTEIYKESVLKAIFDVMTKSSKLFEFHHYPDCHGHGVIQWFSGTQTSTHMMRAEQDDSVVSLTSLLLQAK